jgi:hypothetical protein
MEGKAKSTIVTSTEPIKVPRTTIVKILLLCRGIEGIVDFDSVVRSLTQKRTLYNQFEVFLKVCGCCETTATLLNLTFSISGFGRRSLSEFTSFLN